LSDLKNRADKGNLLPLAAHSPKVLPAALWPLSAHSEALLQSNLRAYRLVGPLLFLDTTPRGDKGKISAEICARLNCSRSGLYKLRRQLRNFGIEGLFRKRRSDRGRPRVITSDLLKAIQERQGAFWKYGAIARAWRAFGRPATYESFRTWCRKESSLAS
jgi:hypothetical protein